MKEVMFLIKSMGYGFLLVSIGSVIGNAANPATIGFGVLGLVFIIAGSSFEK